jgi:hypothetical protein
MIGEINMKKSHEEKLQEIVECLTRDRRLRGEETNLDNKALMNDLNIMSENVRKVYSAFLENKISKTSYPWGQETRRFSATVKDVIDIPIFNSESVRETENYINLFLGVLKNIDIKPQRVYIHDDNITFDWIAVGHGCVEDKFDFFALAIRFAEYLDTVNFCKFSIEVGMGEELDYDYDYYKKIDTGRGNNFEKAFKTLIVDQLDIFDCRSERIKYIGDYMRY